MEEEILYKNALGKITNENLFIYKNSFDSLFKNNDNYNLFKINSISKIEIKERKLNTRIIILLIVVSLAVFFYSNHFRLFMADAIYIIAFIWGVFIFNSVLVKEYILYIVNNNFEVFKKLIDKNLYVDAKILKEELAKIKK